MEKNRSAFLAGAGPHFDNPVRLLDDERVVLDEHECVPAGLDLLEDFPEGFHVAGVQPAGRFVEDNQEAVQVACREARKPEPLDFAAREAVAGTARGEVADAEFVDGLDAVDERVECGFLVREQAFIKKRMQFRFEFRERSFQDVFPGGAVYDRLE